MQSTNIIHLRTITAYVMQHPIADASFSEISDLLIFMSAKRDPRKERAHQRWLCRREVQLLENYSNISIMCDDNQRTIITAHRKIQLAQP
jgi:hypothetical protein